MPVVELPNRAAWRAWLEEHHTQRGGVWVVLHKQSSDAAQPLTDKDAVEEALCFGWIDSRANKIDEHRFKMIFAPRRRGSKWSRVNKERVERLIAGGAMAPAGLAAIQAAKADGSWSALDLVEDLVEPDDLRMALDAQPRARVNWDAFPRSAKRGILEWIVSAKRPATRDKRVTETATLAAENLRANSWPSPKRS